MQMDDGATKKPGASSAAHGSSGNRAVVAIIAVGVVMALLLSLVIIFLPSNITRQSNNVSAAAAATVAGGMQQQQTKHPLTLMAAIHKISNAVKATLSLGGLLTTQQQCQGFHVPAKQQVPPLHPTSTKTPNFIYLLIDDMGYDDLSMHHPATGMHTWVQTPNLNKLVRQSIEFSNFYTTPMCSTSRAELLTGRYYPRTGSMYINTGWDFINANETHIAEVLGDNGYKTAHFGKWHNGRTAGYTPSDCGFVDSWQPTPYVHYNNLFNINGQQVQTSGWMEDNLMNYALDYLKQRKADGKPFFIYYPTFSVHAGWMTSPDAGPRYQRPAPPEFLNKFLEMPISRDTAQLYGMLEHIDYQVGRLLEWLDASGLADHTYIFVGGDNGPALFSNEQQAVPKEVRMPSGMQGSKHDVKEGGIRNFLAVRGPGIAQGSTSHQLAALIDVLPTIAELAGIRQDVSHLTWDGISLVNILHGQQPTQSQQERMYITMQTQCIEDDFTPQLGANRFVLKPQSLLSYTNGGVSGLGFKRCVGVRYKNYKWLADASETQGRGQTWETGGKAVPSGLYKFDSGSHVELSCREISASEPEIATRLESAAAAWFEAMLSDAHSFDRPTFFLGLGGQPWANIVADGVIERTPGRVKAVPMGLRGFEQPGDSAWYRLKVALPGSYEVMVVHNSNHHAKFRLWLGPHYKIVEGTAKHLDFSVGPKSNNKRQAIGTMHLAQTSKGEFREVRLELRENSQQGKPVVSFLEVIVFKLKGATGPAVQYDPELQEGVRDWKVRHGFLGLKAAKGKKGCRKRNC